MLPSLEEIPRLRRALGLSQTQLAALAGVSQGTVAKIERRRTNPSYEVAKRILDCLEAERKRAQRVATCAEVRSRRVIAVGPSTPLEQAIAEMLRQRFSQLPVMEAGRPVGSITERSISDLLVTGRGKDRAALRVADIMEPPFPTVDERAPVSLAASLLQHYPAVLTTSRGEVSGLITKSDLLRLI